MGILINLIKNLKICSRCLRPLSKDEFYSTYDKRDDSLRLMPKCKRCSVEIAGKWFRKHPEKRAEYEQRPEVIAYRKRYKKRPDRKTRHKEWDAKRKPRRAELARERRRSDPKYRLDGRMTCQLNAALRRFTFRKQGREWTSLVGYSLEQLTTHLESLFVDGMSWDNIALWEIDHIIPKSNFGYTSDNDQAFKDCWSLNNLQPLWKSDNRRKNNKIGWNGKLF